MEPGTKDDEIIDHALSILYKYISSNDGTHLWIQLNGDNILNVNPKIDSLKMRRIEKILLLHDLAEKVEGSQSNYAITKFGVKVTMNGGWIEYVKLTRDKLKYEFTLSKFTAQTYKLVFVISILSFIMSVWLLILKLQEP